MEQIKENLKRLREAQDLTQTELADALGVRQSTIGNIESGERLPSLPLAMRIAKHFGVSLSELIGDVEVA